MENLFLAKSKPIETIIEHTNKLIEQYEKIKEVYPELNNINWELLYYACLYHDLGKMNTKFQNHIIDNINKKQNKNIERLVDEYPEIKEIPHGYLSGSFLPISYLKSFFKEIEIKILCESIYYHHNREKMQGVRKEEQVKIIYEDLPKYYDIFKFNKIKHREGINTDFMKYLRRRVLEKYPLVDDDGSVDNEKCTIAKEFIMTKGLLNKIDYAASSNVIVEIKPGNLQECTEKSIEKYGLNELQKYMKENQDKNLIIRASTGIGKTEAALIWIGNNKGFFTLPLRVSINSIYDRIIREDKIGYSKDKTALLHSDTASEYMKRNEEHCLDETYFNSTKQLSYPLTICTLDQLIGFIFKYEGFELKLATLSYSKIVIDEIQMYSPDMVAYLILALRDIVIMGGKFAIITATFPPIFEYFMNYVGIQKDENYVKPEQVFIKEQNGIDMLRHKIKVYEKNIDSQIICNNKGEKKILVIVNTVKTAQRLYRELSKNHKNVFLFHSKFLKEDRAIKESQIFQDGQLEYEFEGIWITTQVVEASLDIDFDVLYTELSDITGLLQRMGRVYRNRLLLDERVNVNVFVGDQQRPSGIYDKNSIIDLEIFERSKEVILKYDNCKIDEKEKMNMVDNVYTLEKIENSKYFNTIKDTINAFNNIIPYDLSKNEARLRDISSELVMPLRIYKENEKYINMLIEELNNENSITNKLKIKEKILNKTLSMDTKQLEKIKGSCILIKITRFEQFYVIPLSYSFEIGLEYDTNLDKFNESQFI